MDKGKAGKGALGGIALSNAADPGSSLADDEDAN